MARLIGIRLAMHSCRVEDGQVVFSPLRRAGQPLVIDDMPMLFWKCGRPWGEVNDYLYHRVQCVPAGELSARSVQAGATALHAYAQWLESEAVDWRHFPVRRAERCLVLYKGALVALIKKGALATSTAAGRMRVALAYYRWAMSQGIIPHADLELEEKAIRVHDAQGFPHQKKVMSSRLAIPNRGAKCESTRLEDGAQPVSHALREGILRIAKQHAPIELYCMLRVGFNTGMRLGSIGDLKIQTLERAVPIVGTELAMAISIGPEADPPVATKFGKSGRGIVIARALRDELLEYGLSKRRGRRERLAKAEDRNLVFLTQDGQRYVAPGLNRSSSVNSLMTALRRIARPNGVDMDRFNFHWTRATFATGYAQIGLELGRIDEAVAFLRQVMLHKDESTTWRYIRYVMDEKNRAQLADQFTRETFGIINAPTRELTDA